MENENVKLIDVQPSNLRKYLYEYAVIGLTASVVFLFFAYRDMNNYITKNLIDQKAELIRTVEKNNSLIQTNNELIKEFAISQKKK